MNYFFDLDGTLARFYEDKNWAIKFQKEGYFIGLKPYEKFVKIVEYLHRVNPSNNIYVISAAPNETGAKEKFQWVKKHLPFIEEKHIFIQICKENSDNPTKAAYVSLLLRRALTKKDVLIDDYNKNLFEWTNAGGTAIKAVNELNNRKNIPPHWDGKTLKVD